MLLLALKLVLTPLMIGGASLGGRRWGPLFGGWLVSLPLTSGPVALFVSVTQGPAFAAPVARASVVGCIALAGYCLVYSWAARWRGWALALGAGLASWVLAAVATQPLLDQPVGPVLLLAGLAIGLALWLLPPGEQVVASARPPQWEVPLRMTVGTGIVIVVTACASILGPAATGLLAMLPVIISVMASFTLHRDGAPGAIGLMRGVLTGLVGTAAFLSVVSAAVVGVGVAGSFVLGLLALVAVQGAILLRVRVGMRTMTLEAGGTPVE